MAENKLENLEKEVKECERENHNSNHWNKDHIEHNLMTKV